MRTYVLALLVIAGLGLTACGSDDSSTDVVPSQVPSLVLPQGADKLATSSSDQTTSSSDQTTTGSDQTQTQGQSSSSSSSSTGTGQTQQQPTQPATGGTSTGSTGGTSSGGTSSGGTGTSGSSGTGGVQPDEFSQFCKDNPGAC